MLDDIKQILANQAVGSLKHFEVVVGHETIDGIPQSLFTKKYFTVMDVNRQGQAVVYEVLGTFLCATLEEAIALRDSVVRFGMGLSA